MSKWGDCRYTIWNRLYYFFFFFQAEDGIRDLTVTGVQTCALPISMGVGTILDARKLLLVASGKTKAKAVAQAVEGPVTSMVTASALQLHRDAIVIVDEEAAAGLAMREYYEFIYAAKPAAPRT